MEQVERVPMANSLVVFREEFDDWAILFDPDSGKAFGINPVGAFIWKHLDGKRGLKQILDEIKDSFEEVPHDAGRQSEEFIAELVKIGFAGYEA